MKIGEAIEALNQGKKVARQGWKSNQYLELATIISKANADDIIGIINAQDATNNRAFVYINTRGMQVSQDDLFSEDWIIKEN